MLMVWNKGKTKITWNKELTATYSFIKSWHPTKPVINVIFGWDGTSPLAKDVVIKIISFSSGQSCPCLFSLFCVTALFITRAKKPYIEITGNIGIFPCTLNLQHHCQNLPILLRPPLHLKPLTTYIISTHGMVFFPNSSMFSF